MAENTERNKALTSTQEGIIAGLVLLFFGLLYWYLNPWQSEQKNVPILAEQTTTGTIQRNSLASTTDASTPSSVTETSSKVTSQTVSSTSTPTSTTVQTTSATSTATPATASTTVASATVAEPVLANSSTPVNTANQTKATADTVPPPPGPVDTQKTDTIASSTAATTEVPKPSTETIASATSPSTEVAKPTTANTNPDPAAQASAAASTETAATATSATIASTVNKLELAPGSPEAKLQSYLENRTLETPVSMDGIGFETKTAKLTKESDAKVLMLAALLAQYPEANFLITSYTTETSTENKNSDELSLMRAQTLGENLVKAGVDGKRITIMGMGKRPSPDKTSVASKKSQRIEISVIQ